MSDDEKAFLRSIVADRANDGPRMVYADWLDEQGRSDEAECIRYQCARRPENGLYQFDKRWWTHNSVGVDSRLVCGWTRGFISAITCTLGEWLDLANRGVDELVPFETITLTRRGAMPAGCGCRFDEYHLLTNPPIPQVIAALCVGGRVAQQSASSCDRSHNLVHDALALALDQLWPAITFTLAEGAEFREMQPFVSDLPASVEFTATVEHWDQGVANRLREQLGYPPVEDVLSEVPGNG